MTTYTNRSLITVAITFLMCLTGAAQSNKSKLVIPELATDYVLVYNPQADVYSGKTVQTLLSGETYNKWQPDEHTFMKGPKGHWHCLGVTLPVCPPDERTWDAKGLSFHAIAPMGTLEDVFLPETWIDQPKFSGVDSGEAPHAIKIGKNYNMIRSSKGLATSIDLHNWKDNGKLEIKDAGRDPNILVWNDTYYLVRCNGRTVNLVTSKDFVNWTDPVVIFEVPVETWQCESPTLIQYNDSFYLFWCLMDSSPYGEKLLELYKGHDPRLYDYRTFVYVSDTPNDFKNREPIAKLKAHAPEIIQDENGNWYISSADYPRRGINLARLEWKAGK